MAGRLAFPGGKAAFTGVGSGARQGGSLGQGELGPFAEAKRRRPCQTRSRVCPGAKGRAAWGPITTEVSTICSGSVGRLASWAMLKIRLSKVMVFRGEPKGRLMALPDWALRLFSKATWGPIRFKEETIAHRFSLIGGPGGGACWPA